MTNNNVTDHDQSSDVRYDIDFQIRKRLAQAGLYDEYVLEIHGNITTTKINPDVEQDSQDIGCINARLIQMGRMINDGRTYLSYTIRSINIFTISTGNCSMLKMMNLQRHSNANLRI